MQPGRREMLMVGAAGLAAAAAGFLVGPLLLQSGEARRAGEGSASESEALRTATLPDLSGRARKLTEWRGRILVCNFWATWCTPCREEIPLLLAARQKYAAAGLEIVGIGIDSVAKIREYSASFNISYPVLIAEANGLELMRRLGNAAGGLPYTVIGNREGGIVYRKLGAFRGQDLDQILAPLVQA
jgi:thiol-disulfide isomerase/thioredoxin